MDRASIVLSVASLVASLIALVVSVVVSTRQSRLAWSGNHAPLVTDLFNESRTNKMKRNEQCIWTALRQEAIDPNIPLSQLPEPFGEAAHSLCMYYQMIACLVFYGVLDRDLAYTPLHYRMARTWEALEPHIYAERELRRDPYAFMNSFEALKSLFGSMDSESMFSKMMKRSKRIRSQ